MRPPFSEIEPISWSVSKVTRGDLASASLSVMACCAGAPELGACGAAPGVLLGEAGALVCADVVCWVCGGGDLAGGNMYCQPVMITTDRDRKSTRLNSS